MSCSRPGAAVRTTLAVLCAVLLAGCTGVPSSSAPRTIESVDIDGGGNQQVSPPRNADPRTLVQSFLGANAIDPVAHDSARAYLTSRARRGWSDTTATIISSRSVSTFVPGRPITVRGRIVGTLTSSGIYVPSLQGVGDGGDLQNFTYTVTRVNGQNRISGLPDGLLLTTDQFAQAYRQHSLYFYDQARRFLVPDPRWSALEGTALDTWLMSELVAGPRAELRNAVLTDSLPVQATSRRVTVTAGSPLKVEIPGAALLDDEAKTQLAAQVSLTVTEQDSGDLVTITDGGSPVRLPGIGVEFAASAFVDYTAPAQPAPDVYYLRDGRVAGETGQDLRGRLGAPPLFLTSIAVTRQADASGLTVAATAGEGADTRLLIGTESAGYRTLSVRGPMSRPTWAPRASGKELWYGVGGKLYRAPVTGNRARPSLVSVPSAAGGGRIVAVRLSPEGARIAIVIASAGGSQQLFVGAVIRSAGQVRVDALQSVSPDGANVVDIAWIGPVKLFAIGSNTSSGDARIFETNVDGSDWTDRNIGALPDPPDSVTAAVGQLAWVSTNDTVWVQDGRSWTPVGSSSQTSGDRPVYLE